MTRPAYRCEVCTGEPAWSITRRGDVAASWACDVDLAAACRRLQRDWEVTELVVEHYAKAVEWASIAVDLESIVREDGGAS